MVVADLHTHTTNSDGSLTLDTLPTAAREAGVEVVAVTDHDRVHPELSAPITDHDGVTVVHGIELRVETDSQRLDLLGYGVERTDALSTLVDDLQSNRIERARKIVDCVEDRLAVDLDVTFEPGVGRPHIARAIEASDADVGYKEAFEQLIGDGRPCFVAREIPSFAEGRKILREACQFVGLAHPFRYDDPESAIARTAELDAIEIPYPYDRTVDRTPAREAAKRHDLLVTGGSDAHDETLGVAGLEAEGYEPIRRRLRG